MKAISALYLMKKHKLIHPSMTLRDLKWVKNEVMKIKSWEEYIRVVMMSMYLLGEDLPEEGIRIPEVQLHIGGTMTITPKGGESFG